MLLCAVIAAMGLFLPLQAHSGETGIPVAFVNGTAIYQADLACAVEASMARKLFSHPGDPPFSKTTSGTGSDTAHTLERLIDIELLYQESLKHRFPGLTEETEDRYRREVRRLGGETLLRSALSCNDMTPDQFRKAIFRNLSIKRYLDKVVYPGIVIEPEEVRAYYDENQDVFRVPESVHLRQIFVKGPKEDSEVQWRSASERALGILHAAREGADFVNLARKYSDDPRGASTGGDMGIVHKGNLHDPFDSVVFTLDAGAITEPLKSRSGFHIFNVITRRPATTLPFEDVQDQITTTLRKRDAQEMVGKILQELRLKADIRIPGKE
ncbi:MAG: peptidylprolyl isomerase [bacterium]|nr:peptidylprolyl isomerase [bacterium]